MHVAVINADETVPALLFGRVSHGAAAQDATKFGVREPGAEPKIKHIAFADIAAGRLLPGAKEIPQKWHSLWHVRWNFADHRIVED